MVVERTFSTHGHTVLLAVEPAKDGWVLREECDSALVHVEYCSRWQRVEQAMNRIEIAAVEHGFPARGTHC